MKVLFFQAAAGHPTVAPALMGQTWTTLRPFTRFIGQAIHTAKERQVRFNLPWERVRNLISIRLEPLDTLLRVPRRLPGSLITNWPADKAPDLTQLAFAVNRGAQLRVTHFAHTAAGLSIQTDSALQTDDRVFWCGFECSITSEGEPSPPTRVESMEGKPLKQLRKAEKLDDGFWKLWVEGQHSDADYRVDGDEVEGEVLSSWEGLKRVTDAQGKLFEVTEQQLRLEEPPAEGILRGDNGMRFRWSEAGSTGRKGLWVQLLPPEQADSDELLDPRVAFCEDEVDQVWTSKARRAEDTYKVKKVDRDRFQLLLDRLPPEGSTLYLPVDLRNLYLQQRALKQLADAPLPHHQGLLRLCEDPRHVRWPTVVPRVPQKWYALTDETRSGTQEQRTFVSKALGSPDLAFLEGPPGSGKTTAICEIIQQLIDQGKRILLCASTHVAIDNVLERLLASDSPVDAVRIGKADKVDDKVLACQLDARVEALVTRWRSLPEMADFGGKELEEMAKRSVIMAANLTCGTTMGIVNHPLFQGRDQDVQVWDRPITSMPHWDVLIIDEASKTLIQEFMVPALMARRHIIVGDVHQLPPFADRGDIVANLRDLVDEKDVPIFPRDHQRACLLISRMLRKDLQQPRLRWLFVEPPSVIDCMVRELEARTLPESVSVVRLVSGSGVSDTGKSGNAVATVTVAELKTGAAASLRVMAAQWVLVADDLLPSVSKRLPSNLLMARDVVGTGGPLQAGDALLLRQAWWLGRTGALESPYRERKFKRDDITKVADAQACEQDWLHRNDLGQELAWRLTRLHELRHSNNQKERDRLKRQLKELEPRATNISEALSEIQDIGLPSILEVLQTGIGAERTRRPSALTEGLPKQQKAHFQARFGSLSFQHRMHPEISDFSRDVIYHGGSLQNANTIESRDLALGWSFGPFAKRRVWADVKGREQSGENPDEVTAIRDIVQAFIEWVRVKGPPARKEPRVWEVACLSFYVKQDRAVSQMLRKLTQDDRHSRFTVQGLPIEIVCGTVDRFQGREADLVLLSMRNTQRTGFLDSPNRLNVAVTRARQQLVVVGNASFYGDCGISELTELVKRSPLLAKQDIRSRRQPRT